MPKPFSEPQEVRAVLTKHCADCHGDEPEGNVRLDGLEKLSLGDRLDLLDQLVDVVGDPDLGNAPG